MDARELLLGWLSDTDVLECRDGEFAGRGERLLESVGGGEWLYWGVLGSSCSLLLLAVSLVAIVVWVCGDWVVPSE